MTDVVFYKDNDIIRGFECSGHTGYSHHGSDIVCSALSSITQACVLGLKSVVGINLNMKKVEEEGYLKIELPKKLQDDKLDKSQVLLKTLYLAVEDLAQGYSKFIKLEERDYVY